MEGNPAASWNAEYAAGRYAEDPPVSFVEDILVVAAEHRLHEGIYIGCGNGRNLLPMLDAGLDLVGLDISTEAIAQLRRRHPDRVDKLLAGDLSALPGGIRYGLVIGIQVFQHGTRAEAHRHLNEAAARVAPGGLLCVRVNATATDLEYDHDVRERDADGSFTVRYRTGPKTRLDIHFFTAAELEHLLGGGFTAVLPCGCTAPTEPRPLRDGGRSGKASGGALPEILRSRCLPGADQASDQGYRGGDSS